MEREDGDCAIWEREEWEWEKDERDIWGGGNLGMQGGQARCGWGKKESGEREKLGIEKESGRIWSVLKGAISLRDFWMTQIELKKLKGWDMKGCMGRHVMGRWAVN
jgi:hypothetical protein